MDDLQNLKKKVLLVDRSLDTEANIPEAARRLTLIHTEMVEKLGPKHKMVYDLENIMAELQPYLIEPNFMAGDANG